MYSKQGNNSSECLKAVLHDKCQFQESLLTMFLLESSTLQNNSYEVLFSLESHFIQLKSNVLL